MNRIFRFLADLVYPARCPICGAFAEWDELICEKCKGELEETDESVCSGCGNCVCICERAAYTRTVTAFFYDGTARRGILSLKDGAKEFGYFVGRFLGEKIKESGEMNADIIVPVPMSPQRRRERRYNQAEVIADGISEITGIRKANGILYKTGSAVQHELNSEQRRENVSAFGIRECSLDGMKILLCDDVLTTGSTMCKCAELLKTKGAAEIYAAVGATTKLKKKE